MGFIGAGANTTSRHLPGFAETGVVDFVAVANRSRESGERVAAQFGIARVAGSPDEIIADRDIDAVCIGTWPYKHREYTVAALRAGKHVLCEARMAGTLDDAIAMHQAARDAPGLVAQLVPAPFDFRLGPTIARLIAEGALGEITEVVVSVMNGAALDRSAPLHWRNRADYSGRNVMTLGIFNEVVQRWLGDTTRVMADGAIVVKERIDPETGRPFAIDIPDSYAVLSRLARGARATYLFSAVTAGAPPAGISVYGTDATLHWQMGDTARWAKHGRPFEELQPDPGTDRGWRVEADFVASVLEGAPVRLTNFDDGLKYMRFIDGAWQSWQSGRAVEL
jgi:predicted dehydrogenase